MHMLPRPSQAPIVTAGRPAGEVAQALWQRLLAEPWPLPLQALAAGTALVGGAVRDGLLGCLEPQPDLDFVVDGDAIALTRQLARDHGGTVVILDVDHNIARLVLGGWNLDLARRGGSSLEADLLRRDYSVNAIALPLPSGGGEASALVDPSGGLGHLQQRQLVALSEANLLADPLRLLRGIRLASSLGFALEPSSAAWIQSHGAQLTTVAGERVLAELTKLAAAQQGERGLAQALAWNLLQGWGADASANLAGLSLERARQRGLLEGEIEWALPLARICALLPPQALAGLRSSNRLQQRCRALRHWQQQVAQVGCWANLPEPSCLALQRQLEADFPALVLLLAEPAPQLLERWRNPADPLFHPRSPLDGRSLQQQLAIPAGPELGQLLEHLSLERSFGRLAPGPEGEGAALAAAESWWRQRQGRRRD